MKKLVLASLMCCMAVMSSYADGIHFGTALDSTDYIIPAPRANWFIGVNGGVNALIGNEGQRSAQYTGITPQVNLEIGKWVLPDLAITFDVSGFSMKGQTKYSLQPNVPFKDNQSYDYTPFKEYGLAVNGGFIFDWTSFFHGFDRGQERIYHFQTPINFGVAYERGAYVNEHRKNKGSNGSAYHGNYEFNTTLGIRNEFRVAPRFSIVNDIKCLVTRGSWDYSGTNFDGSKPESKGPRFDLLPAVTLGFQYDLSGKEASRSKDGYAAVPTGVNRYFANVEGYRGDIKGLQDENDELRKELGELKGLIDDLKNRPAEIQYVEKAAEPEPVVVYFKIDHWDLLPEAKTILRGYADVINNSKPEEKFYVIGGADSATGSSKRNVLLSNNRSRVVYEYLTKECGVDASKLEKRALGGIAEFLPIEMNRMTIVAPKAHRMCTIIDKWANETDNDIKK